MTKGTAAIRHNAKILMQSNFVTFPARKSVCKLVTMYFAGMIVVKSWISLGILEISKMNPDSINAGKNEVIIAICAAIN